jgi:methylenetetrahydrofolate reductase (NADPH)
VRIADIFKSGPDPVFSFEFFPPKGEKGRDALLATIADLEDLAPSFVSVTYGAGGSTRDRTLELVSYIKNRVGIEAMAHLTCVGATRDEISGVLDALESASIENVIALRGDPPQDAEDFVPHPDGLAHALDLIEMIRGGDRPICLAAACYPEVHPQATSPEDDLAHTIAKVRAGAEVLISQLFFDNECYFRFVEKVRAEGINVPIVPGIMPITNVAQIERFTRMCGASIPDSLSRKLEPVREEPDAVVELGIEHSVEQCAELLAGGAPGVHFYTLNRSRSTRDILSRLRELRPWRR